MTLPVQSIITIRKKAKQAKKKQGKKQKQPTELINPAQKPQTTKRMGLSKSSTSGHQYLEHPLFGQVVIDESLQNNYQCVSIEASYQLPDQISVDRWLNGLNCNFDGLRADENGGFMHLMFDKGYEDQEKHLASFMLPIKYQWKQQGMFGKGGVLQQQIEQRANSGRSFRQTELWLLLYKLIELQCHFEKRGKKIGNVHPCNILINQRLHFKVFGKHSSIDGMDNFEEMSEWLKQKSQNLKAKAFLAPEEIQGINNRGQIYINENVNKSEVFSVGLTLLCAMMLTTGGQFYQIDARNDLLEIRLDQVYEALGYLRQRYSSFLYNLMCELLNPNPQERISATHVYSSLKEYRPDILGLREFLPETKQIKQTKRELTEQKSLPRTLSEFEVQLEEYKREREFKKGEQAKLRQFYRKWKY